MEQIQYVHVEMKQDLVQTDQGESPLSSQNIMDMRLRNSGDAGQTALAQLAVADPFPQVSDQPPLELVKVHE